MFANCDRWIWSFNCVHFSNYIYVVGITCTNPIYIVFVFIGNEWNSDWTIKLKTVGIDNSQCIPRHDFFT